jgi:hypothetical protein
VAGFEAPGERVAAEAYLSGNPRGFQQVALPIPKSTEALNHFAITFEDRLPAIGRN